MNSATYQLADDISQEYWRITQEAVSTGRIAEQDLVRLINMVNSESETFGRIGTNVEGKIVDYIVVIPRV